MKTHDTLHGGAALRLRKYRAYAAAWNANPRHHARGLDWRRARRHFGPFLGVAHGLSREAIEPVRGYVSAPFGLVDGWRDVGHADSVAPRLIDHRGWYSDAYGGVYRGHVWQLPARNGSPRYVAGYIEAEGRDGDGRQSGYVVIEHDGRGLVFHDTTRDAAWAADELARVNAERDREYSERWTAASVANGEREDAREDFRSARKVARAVVAAWREQRKAGPLVPSVCDVLRARLDDARERMRDALERIETARERIAELDMEKEF